MSTTTAVSYVRAANPPRVARQPGAIAFGAGFLQALCLWIERGRQRAALAALADDPHLLSDIGLTREQALHEAGKAFWR